ncbi:MAG: hypothetical protein ACYTGX_13385 [Planctomycetota bacterium]|jgi:hypothetical protein
MTAKHILSATMGTAVFAAFLLAGSPDVGAAASAPAPTRATHARTHRAVAARRAHHARRLESIIEREEERATAKGRRGRGRWGGKGRGRGRGRR